MSKLSINPATGKLDQVRSDEEITELAGSASPSSIKGTGGRVVTNSADMISGGTGMVSNAGTVQIQNSAGSLAYMQLLASQWRVSSHISQLRWRLNPRNLTSTSVFTDFITRVNMSSTGQVVRLAGNSNQGYFGYIVKVGGNPFDVVGFLGGSITGYPSGVTLSNNGDCILVQQTNTSEYTILASNFNLSGSGSLNLPGSYRETVSGSAKSTFDIGIALTSTDQIISVLTDNGVSQLEKVQSVSGTSVTLSDAVPVGTKIEIIALQANSYTVGTVSDGAITPEKISRRITKKEVSANITTAGALTELQLNNLVSGEKYRIKLSARIYASGSDDVYIQVLGTDSSVIDDNLLTGQYNNRSDSNILEITVENEILYQASSSGSVTFVFVKNGSSGQIRLGTYVTIEKYNFEYVSDYA